MVTNEKPLELIDYLNIIRERKWLIIIPTVLIAVATAIISFLLPPKWEVDMIILPGKFLFQTQQGEFDEIVAMDPKEIVGMINQKSYNSMLAAEINLDEKKFPAMYAENIPNSKLVRIAIRNADVTRAKSILLRLYDHLKTQLDKIIDVEVKAINSRITSYDKVKKERELDIRSKEIEKSKIRQQILSAENKQKISEQRFSSITEEMKSVKKRIEDIEEQQQKTLEGKKEEIEAISLLLYSNEIQQNFRYYNTLEEKLSEEKIDQENLRLIIKESQEEIKRLDTDVEKLKNEIEEITNQKELLNEKKARIEYIQLIKDPTSSLFPVSPRKSRNVMLAGIFALIIFTILAFSVDYVQKHAPRARTDSSS